MRLKSVCICLVLDVVGKLSFFTLHFYFIQTAAAEALKQFFLCFNYILFAARTLPAHRILKTFYQWHLFGVRNGNAKRSETNNSKRWRELKNSEEKEEEEDGDESGKKRRPYLLIHIELSVIKSVGYATLFEIFTALCVSMWGFCLSLSSPSLPSSALSQFANERPCVCVFVSTTANQQARQCTNTHD